MNKQINHAFPLPTYRPGQQEVITKILEYFQAGQKIILLEAPTGAGKSAIGFTLAQLLYPAYYLTPQKFLQDQLTTDFGEHGKYIKNLHPMIDLKGRGNYLCEYYKSKSTDPNIDLETKNKLIETSKNRTMCDVGECKRQGKSKLPYCTEEKSICPYYNRLNQAIYSNICLMNFHSFLFQSSITKRFGQRKLLILDESHDTDETLLRFIELNISDKSFIKKGIRFPIYETIQEYLKYFEEIDLSSLIQEEIALARVTLHPKEEEEWERMLIKYNILLESDPERWVLENKSNELLTNISIKPIFADELCQKYILSFADHILMMSATILSKNTMCTCLGLDPNETKMLRMGSTFPHKNRPIYYKPCGPLSYYKKTETYPKLIKSVNEICEKYKDKRGIIHTHNFEIANLLLEKCSNNTKNRFLYQKDMEFHNDKHLMIKKHSKQENPNSIILAPACHIGLSLDDDLARFQIICKVPYPSKADAQIQARMELTPEFYPWKTCTSLIQSIGRIVRHKDDYGDTYILDEDFLKFYKINKKLFPDWIIEAIRGA